MSPPPLFSKLREPSGPDKMQTPISLRGANAASVFMGKCITCLAWLTRLQAEHLNKHFSLIVTQDRVH